MKTALSFKNLDLAGKDLFENGVLAHLDGFLLEVADTGAACEEDLAVIGIFLTGNDAEHSRFARAVRTDQRQAVVILQLEGDVGEQRSAAERLRNVGNLHYHVNLSPAEMLKCVYLP